MQKINWDPSYSVGVKLFDEQHKRIIAMINMLNSDHEVTVHSETVSELLDRLTKYASDHFRAEEKLMEEYDYPDLAEHKVEHKEYRLKVVALCQAAIIHDESVPTELQNFLCNWWQKHVLETDMEYRSFFIEHGVK